MERLKAFFDTEDKFARHAGLVLDEVTLGGARGSMKIERYHLNGAKTVHGGAMFTLADFVFAAAANSRGLLSMGIATSMSFVKAATSGTLHAVATEVACNQRLATYSVQISDDSGDLVALFQGTVYRKNVELSGFMP